jgi:hypothetical protein
MRKPLLVVMLGPGVAAPFLWTFTLDVITSIASELQNRILYSPSAQVEQIPYEQCLQYRTFATFSAVVLVEVRQERFSSSIEIRPFSKSLNQS